MLVLVISENKMLLNMWPQKLAIYITLSRKYKDYINVQLHNGIIGRKNNKYKPSQIEDFATLRYRLFNSGNTLAYMPN